MALYGMDLDGTLRYMNNRKPFELDEYIQRIQNNPCFICEMVAGRLNENHIVYQDQAIIVFVNKYPPRGL